MRKTVCGILLVAAGTASAQAPAITASGTTFSFASTPIYVTTPSTATITLTNSGTGPLLISSIAKSGANATEFEVSGSCDPNGSPVTVNANATCTINASFTPLSGGSRSATLTVLSNAATNPSITVSGTATVPSTPSIVLSTTNLIFNTTTVAAPSGTRQITVVNNGSQPVMIQSVTSSNPEFVTTPAANCANLAAGDICTINTTFTPAAAGTSTGMITITSNASGTPHRITVSGPGVMTATGAATLAANTLSFPSTPTGTTATVLRTTLKNTGNAPLTVAGAAINGTNAAEFKLGAGSTCTTVGTLSVDQSCDLEADFTPQATGARSGSLVVTHGAGTSTVALDGTATAPPPPPAAPTPTTPAPTTPTGSSAQAPNSGGGGAIDLAALLLLAPGALLGWPRRSSHA
ncbi:MAG TPA: choice-of-anchor D domain-containing protein [Burkholderiaceae bacterium]|nr:choice-of-anchor D domain-containing protein [Burkholderiaceae bacterium]